MRQGRVLGPILFTIYINSILTPQTAVEMNHFADDTVFLYQDVS